MKLKEIVSAIENYAPLVYQESYDNAGLTIGTPSQEINSALLTIDVTEEVIDEAIAKSCNLIISHHPLIFSGIKKICGNNYIERSIIKAISNKIAIYSAHTNLDSVDNGVNKKICEKLGLVNTKILEPATHQLCKLVAFVPVDYAEAVRSAIFEAGAGSIGSYDMCSYNVDGKGSFRASANTHPFVGEIGKLHFENETRIEIIFPKNLQNRITDALLHAHPYEEVAYDIYPLENTYSKAGMGMVGELPVATNELEFLKKIKNTFNIPVVRYTQLRGKKISRVAVCGGSGSFLLKDAIAAGADLYLSADFKYHQFFDADSQIVIADIGHFESEQFTVEIFYDILKKNFPTFAIYLSETKSNPINYL
ncbi:MAG: Nif3-like dinuclear metal center hexameric protein [Bacteroidota bacterium]|nr:Nif3-like dinuclear metal center hexameric protein [Bacteroidota bacterium]